MQLFIARYESRHFSFEAIEETREGAMETLAKGLQMHGMQYGCDASWFNPDDIEIHERIVGLSYRDGSEIQN
jgi:hypothetical protein